MLLLAVKYCIPIIVKEVMGFLWLSTFFIYYMNDTYFSLDHLIWTFSCCFYLTMNLNECLENRTSEFCNPVFLLQVLSIYIQIFFYLHFSFLQIFFVICLGFDKCYWKALYLKNNANVRHSQHVFTKGKSCISNLLSFYNKVTCLMDKGKEVYVILLNSGKVFILFLTISFRTCWLTMRCVGM